LATMKINVSLLFVAILCNNDVIDATHAKKYSNRPRTISEAPEEYIFTLGGTENVGNQEVSNGNVNPEVSLPWGFNGWSPQTSIAGGGWWFYSESHNLYGIRCTKQPSPWIGDYGNFRIMAHLVDPDHESVSEYSPYDPKKTNWSPYHFQTNLLAYGTNNGYTSLEVTPTMYGSLLRVNFPALDDGPVDVTFNQTRRLMFALDNPDSDSLTIQVDNDNNQIVIQGYSTANSGGVPSNFKHYFYATISTADQTPFTLKSSAVRTDDNQLWGFVDIDQTSSASADSMIVRVATSLISSEQAFFNWQNEVAGVDFDDAVANAKQTWNEEMNRVSVNDVGDYSDSDGVDRLTVFYSALYRAAKYPRTMWEVDMTSGSNVHWSPYTGETVDGLMSSDQGFWDAYRSTYSLLALWRPSRLALQMDGWLNAWREGGWVPQWSSPGYRGSMTGTMSDVSMSEAIMKLPHCGSTEATTKGYCVDAATLLNASLQNAYQVPIATEEGRECLEEYINLGYVPYDGGCDAVVSRTLNYLHADWALAQAAAMLDDNEHYEELSARAANWTLLLNPDTGFLAPRNMDGSFASGFDEYAWGDSRGYTESGPWQYRLEVPYDPTGLQSTLSDFGFDAASIVEEANTIESYFHVGGYGTVIHEQAEMAVNCWGQWAVNNQPVFALQSMQVAFDTSVMGEKAGRAQGWLRQSLDLFTATSDMYPGDEDNGSMGAWYVLNSLGIYPLSPASGDYVISSPQFANVTISIGGELSPSSSNNKKKKVSDIEATLTITANNQGSENVYVQSVTWNGEALDGVIVSYADLMLGGNLHFEMGPSPAASSP